MVIKQLIMHAIFQPVVGPVSLKAEDLFKTLREIDQEFSFSSVKLSMACPEASDVYARLELEALINGKAGPELEENY